MIQWATGAVGAEMVKIMAERPGFEVVGAIVHPREKAGRDLGEVVRLGRPLGVLTSANPQELFSRVRADLVLHAAAADLQANVVDIHSCVEAGLDVITVSGLSYPWRRHPRVARRLDEAAQAQGVTILGTGINPGYLLDLLPVALSGLCARVDRIYMRRVSEMGHYLRDIAGMGQHIASADINFVFQGQRDRHLRKSLLRLTVQGDDRFDPTRFAQG